jgi:hypothetical protein
MMAVPSNSPDAGARKAWVGRSASKVGLGGKLRGHRQIGVFAAFDEEGKATIFSLISSRLLG